MRKNKELLQVFLDNQHLFKTGICGWVMDLYIEGAISFEERMYLLGLIRKNEPVLTKIGLQGDGLYYWEKGNIKPRIKWLKKHLR